MSVACSMRLTFVCRMKEILEPLAIANNVTQARYTRLDHIGLTLGNLYRIYSDLSIEAPIRDRVLSSLEKRWQAADQDVFILAMHLHPWVRGRCFAKTLSRSALCNTAEKVYRRLFEQEPGWGFMGEMMDYSDGLGIFSDESMRLGYWKQHYDGSVCRSQLA